MEPKAGDEIKVEWGRFGEVTTVIHHVSKKGQVYAHRARNKYQLTTNPQPVYWHELGAYWSIYKYY